MANTLAYYDKEFFNKYKNFYSIGPSNLTALRDQNFKEKKLKPTLKDYNLLESLPTDSAIEIDRSWNP